MNIVSFFFGVGLVVIIVYLYQSIDRIIDIFISLFFNNKDTPSNSKVISYQKKSLLTPVEKDFLAKLKPLEGKYLVIPQVNLASIVNKANARYRSELFRNVDYGIFDKDYNCLLLIELNDKTHEKNNRKSRDLKVKKILNDAGYPLLTFYTSYPNEQDYVVNRILKTLKENNLE